MANNNRKISNRAKKAIGWNKFWIILTILLAIVYIVWRIFFTYPHNKGTESWVFWVVLLLVEMFGLFEMVIHYYNMYDFEKSWVKKGVIPDTQLPAVDVLVPTLNEPEELLEKTLEACLKMEYPNPKKVHIYLCDDGERDSVKALADRMGVNYLGRTEHDNAKAGNLNYALAHSGSPLVAIFDADMMPHRDFLMETVPYFAENIRKMNKSKEKVVLAEGKNYTDDRNSGKGLVGFVQTPQSFYEPDLFQINLFQEDSIPNEQDYFYKVVQLSKNKSNSVIFGGSNAVLSRKALADIGGIVTGVLTEDFATGIELEKRGYQGIAINKELASGKTPDTFSGLIRQRKRWAKGCIQSGKKTHFLLSRQLTLIQKLNYLTAVTYWYTPVKRLVYYLAPVLFALFGLVVVECSLWQVLLFWLPMYLCSNVAMRRFSQGIRTTKWTDIYENTLFPFLLLPVVKETFIKSKNRFLVTKKEGGMQKTSRLYYMLPFIAGAVIAGYSIYRLIMLSVAEETPTYAVVLFWLLINMYYMIVSTLAVWGRRVTKKGEYSSPAELKRGFRMDVSLVAFVNHILYK